MISARTLSPRERIDALDSAPDAPGEGADERWAWWKKAYFPHRDAAWEHWLGSWRGAADGRTVVEIDTSLTVNLISKFAWLDHLSQVRDFSPETLDRGRTAVLSPVAAVIQPFLDHARHQLARDLGETGLSAEEADKICTAALSSLKERLTSMSGPSTAVAVNIQRLTLGQPDETTEARLRRFEESARTWPARLTLLAATPVLDRLLAQVSLDATQACLTFARHLAADRDKLRQTFGVDPRSVNSVAFGLGDPHRQGTTVARLSFAGGCDIVYKPRGMSVDLVFNGLLTWLSRYVEDCPTPVLTLDCGDHGWARFVVASECGDEADVRRAYRRTGILLAAFDLCAGGDLHFENIVYEGPNPVIVDLETLLCPAVAQSDALANLQYRARIESMLRTGYLPGGQIIQDFRRDLSAASLHTTLETPFVEHVYLEDDGDMLAVRQRPYRMRPRENCASLGGRRIAVADHLTELCEGMRQACLAFTERSDELLSTGGPLESLREVDVRWVVRGTNVYGQAFRSSLHPAHLRDGFDHELAFAEMAHWGPGGHLRQDILQAEIADLWRCDIPIFTTRGDSRDAWTSSGELIPEVFHESGWDALCRRVDQLRECAVDRSARAALCAFESVEAESRPHPSRPVERDWSLGQTSWLEQARLIGERLTSDLIDVDSHPFWVTPQTVSRTAYSASLTGFDLYQGSAGIGLFFNELAKATGNQRFMSVAQRCRGSNRLFAESDKVRPGAFDGLAGALYAELRFAGEDPFDESWAGAILERLIEFLPTDEKLDVIGGASGILLVARHLTAGVATKSPATALMEACAEHLAQSAQRTDGAVYWSSPGFAEPNRGFAHGSAGHASALAVASAELETTRWDELIEGGLNYTSANSGGGSWCHGDIGRLTAFDLVTRHRPDLAQSLAKDVVRWRRRRENSLAGGNDSLCHGVMGNIDGLVGGAESDRGLAFRAASLAQQSGWLPSVGTVNPGLMLGMSGIGYQLLRLRYPSIGSILELAISANPEERNGSRWGCCV